MVIDLVILPDVAKIVTDRFALFAPTPTSAVAIPLALVVPPGEVVVVPVEVVPVTTWVTTASLPGATDTSTEAPETVLLPLSKAATVTVTFDDGVLASCTELTVTSRSATEGPDGVPVPNPEVPELPPPPPQAVNKDAHASAVANIHLEQFMI